MNQMDKVCNMLDLSLFEKFCIIKKHPNMQRVIRNPYYFTDEGIINSFGVLDNGLLADLIIGCLKIEKI